MSEFHKKIDAKKVKLGDEESTFREISKAYAEWIKGIEKFHTLPREKQLEFIKGFGLDFNTLLLILQEYVYQRTDDVDDRGNGI